jgi:hypothetical protein
VDWWLLARAAARTPGGEFGTDEETRPELQEALA